MRLADYLVTFLKGKSDEDKLELLQERKVTLVHKLDKEKRTEEGMKKSTKQDYRSVLSKIIQLEQKLGIKDYR